MIDFEGNFRYTGSTTWRGQMNRSPAKLIGPKVSGAGLATFANEGCFAIGTRKSTLSLPGLVLFQDLWRCYVDSSTEHRFPQFPRLDIFSSLATTYEDMRESLARGYLVFPVHETLPNGRCSCNRPNCSNTGKHPRTQNGHLAATNDINQLEQWWRLWPETNYGIRTGKESGIWVLDIDGEIGKRNLDRLVSEHGPLPETRTVRTGSGGIHIYYKHPGFEIKNTRGRLAEGIDTRGDGGFVVGPGSRHQSGNQYKLISDEQAREAADPPVWLLKLMEKENRKQERLPTVAIIGEGGRNDRLFKEASRLRGLGWGESQIYDGLVSRNQSCNPPLSEDELRKIASQAAKYEPNPILLSSEQDHVGDAYRLLTLYGENLRYSPERKKWLIYEGDRWQFDIANRITNMAVATMRETQNAAKQKGNTAIERWVTESINKNGIGRMITLASAVDGVPILVRDLDKDSDLFNVRNGTIDTKSGKVYEHSRNDFITQMAAAEYDPEARSETWENFISSIFRQNPEVIPFVQRSLGYALTGSTSEQVMWIAYGRGANGKSTLLNTIKRLMGTYATTTPFNTFDTGSQNSIGNDLAELAGKRLVLTAESEANRRLAEAKVKTVTGGDDVKGRFLFENNFEFTPQLKLWMPVNHLPTIRGSDHGIWRRILLVPFKERFEGESRVMNLEARFQSEFSGILNWLITGLRDYRENGLKPPKSVEKATEDYKHDMDEIRQWLEERTQKVPGKKASVTEAFQDYQQWSNDRGEGKFTLGLRYFTIAVTELGFEKVRQSKGYFFTDLDLTPPGLTPEKG